MDYDIRIIHSDGSYSMYSKVCEEKSGGETQTPFYVTVAASFVQLYKNNIGGEAIGLMLFDEAFNNMDDERIGGVLEFLRRLPLQILESIHVLMKLLESKKLIRIIWKDNKQDYMIQKVRLMTYHIEEAYQYVGRKPKRGLEEENITLLQKYLDVEAPITVNFVRYLLERLQNYKSVKEYIMHFRDSKYFEQIENRIAKVFRQFSEEYAEMKRK